MPYSSSASHASTISRRPSHSSSFGGNVLPASIQSQYQDLINNPEMLKQMQELIQSQQGSRHDCSPSSHRHRSRSSHRHRSSSSHRHRSRSSRRHRSSSSHRHRSRSSHRNRSPSLHRNHSPSSHRNRSPSSHRNRSPSSHRNRSRSRSSYHRSRRYCCLFDSSLSLYHSSSESTHPKPVSIKREASRSTRSISLSR